MERTRITAKTGVILVLILRTISSIRLTEEEMRRFKSIASVQSYDGGFHISNVTFPCNQTQNSGAPFFSMFRRASQEPVKRLSKLPDDDMRHLFTFKGGTSIPEYLAANKKSAQSNFVDAKQLRFGSTMFTKWRRWVTPRWDNYHLYPPSIGPHSSQNYPSYKGGTPFTLRPWNSHQVIRGLNKQKFGKRRKRQLGDTISPPDDSSSSGLENEICSEAGNPSDFNHNLLHLCTICSANRRLPDDRFPQYVNEVYCKPSQGGCLGNNNGKCVSTVFNVHILKKRDDICRLCVKDSEAVAVNEWEPYIQAIHVGCECMLDKNSNYKNIWFQTAAPQSTTHRTIKLGPLG